jgi:hypothetical protein
LNVDVEKVDEFESLTKGLQYIDEFHYEKVFTYSKEDGQ